MSELKDRLLKQLETDYSEDARDCLKIYETLSEIKDFDKYAMDLCIRNLIIYMYNPTSLYTIDWINNIVRYIRHVMDNTDILNILCNTNISSDYDILESSFQASYEDYIDITLPDSQKYAIFSLSGLGIDSDTYNKYTYNEKFRNYYKEWYIEEL